MGWALRATYWVVLKSETDGGLDQALHTAAGGGGGDVRGALVWLPDVGVGGVLGLVWGPCGGGSHGGKEREGLEKEKGEMRNTRLARTVSIR